MQLAVVILIIYVHDFTDLLALNIPSSVFVYQSYSYFMTQVLLHLLMRFQISVEREHYYSNVDLLDKKQNFFKRHEVLKSHVFHHFIMISYLTHAKLSDIIVVAKIYEKL